MEFSWGTKIKLPCALKSKTIAQIFRAMEEEIRWYPSTVSCLFISEQNKRYPNDSTMFIHLQTKPEISLRQYHDYSSPNKTRDTVTTVSCLFISKQNKPTNKLKNGILIRTHTCLMLRNCDMIASAFLLNMLICTAWPAYLYSHRRQAAVADTIRIYWIKTAVTSEKNEFPKRARISRYLPIISHIISPGVFETPL